MDWATLKIPTGRLSNTLDASFCDEALNEVIAKYGKSEIMNFPSRALLRNTCRAVDQRSQFTGPALITTLTDAKIKISRLRGVGVHTLAGNRGA